jgi:hypothetical protein
VTPRPLRLLPWPLVPFALGACFDPADPPADPSSTGTEAATGSGSSPTSDPSATTSPGSSSASDSVTTDPSTTTDPTATTDSSATTPGDTTDGGGTPSICDGAPTDLAACGQAFDGTPAYGTVACEPTDPSFDIFYEDVFAVSLIAGDCLYIRVDNVGADGPTGVAAGDMALEIRSPSGAYGFFDDVIACTDPPWLGGGACPQALIFADVDGTYEVAITQVSGAGCINPEPYAVWAAINGAELALPAAPDVDEALVDCSGV